MSTDNTDITDIELSGLVNKPFEIRKDFRIEVALKAYENICFHAQENYNVEICGVLIGEVYKDTDGPYLEILDSIRGEYADNKMGEVTFTQETWSYINAIKDEKYPDKKIVGWYHSHPRFGVFLSQQDTFIHKNFFNEPWQVAYVIDPHSNEEGFFIWHNGGTVKLEYFWLEGSKKYTPKVIKNPQKELIEKISADVSYVAKRTRKILRPHHFVIGLIILLVLFTLGYSYLLDNMNRTITPVMDQIKIEKPFEDKGLQKLISGNDMLSDLNIRFLRRGNQVWCFVKVYTYFQQQLILRIVGSQPNVESVDIRGIIPTHTYKTSPGETLGGISKKIYGTPDRWKDILQLNKHKIDNQNKMQPFITLDLPE